MYICWKGRLFEGFLTLCWVWYGSTSKRGDKAVSWIGHRFLSHIRWFGMMSVIPTATEQQGKTLREEDGCSYVGRDGAAADNLFARRKSIFKASLNCLIAINQISIFQFYNLPSAASSKMNQKWSRRRRPIYCTSIYCIPRIKVQSLQK